MPNLDFVCRLCERKQEEEGQKKLEELNATPDHLKGLGYLRADQDGYNESGQERCSPEDHNAELLEQAAIEMLDAKTMSHD
jgi:hypothetical protein